MHSPDPHLFTQNPDEPYALASPEERHRRLGLLVKSHMTPLAALVDTIRERRGATYAIPHSIRWTVAKMRAF